MWAGEINKSSLDGKATVNPVKLLDTCISRNPFVISDKHDTNENLKLDDKVESQFFAKDLQ